MVLYTVKIYDSGLRIRLDRMSKTAVNNVADANFRFATTLANSMKSQFLMQQKMAPRKHLASLMKARRINKTTSGVYVPQVADWLDSMKPHYVALKPWRNINKWASKYYVGIKMWKSGKSRVWKRHGRIVYNQFKPSALYVTPDPFIDKAIVRVWNKHKIMLSAALKKAVEGR